MKGNNILTTGMAQIAPVWFDKGKTISKVKSYIAEAGEKKCEIVVFGEGLIPGYPFWLSLTNGAEFNSQVQKELHAHYARNSIRIESRGFG